MGSVLLWASSGQPLVTRSPSSQRVKPGETLGSQGPVRVSREKRKDSLPLCRSWPWTPCRPHCQQLSTQLLRSPR